MGLFPRGALALVGALVASCGASPAQPGPCMSDRECRADRICHEGSCRFEEEVRAELDARRRALETPGGETLADAGVVTAPDAGVPAQGSNDERPMFMGGPRHTGRTATRGPTSALRVRWVHRSGARVPASPILGADGTVYVGSHDRSFVALASDGTLRWRYAAGDRFYASAAVAADGTIVVGNHDRSISALTPQGQVRWRRVLGAPVDASPTIDDDGTIYVAADGLWALDPATGQPRWHHTTADALRTSPAVHPQGLVIVGTTDGRVLAVRRTGELAWEARAGASVDGGAAIGDDGTIYVGNDLGHVLALDASGAERWRYQTEGVALPGAHQRSRARVGAHRSRRPHLRGIPGRFPLRPRARRNAVVPPRPRA